MFKYITWDNFCMKLVNQNILTATKCKFEYALRNVFTRVKSTLQVYELGSSQLSSGHSKIFRQQTSIVFCYACLKHYSS